MAAHIHVYSGSAAKEDGHEGLATRIVECRLDPVTERQIVTRPFSVIPAWHGVDGALLKPVVAKENED